MNRSFRLAVLPMLAASLAAAAPPLQSAGADGRDMLETIRRADVRLAAIGFRLATANVALCDRRQPATGLQLHVVQQYAPQYRQTLRQSFGFGSRSAAVEGVVPGSPAARAGVREGDAVVRIAGEATGMAAADGPTTTAPLVAIENRLAALPPTGAIRVDLERGGEARAVTIRPVPACRSRFELLLSDRIAASANGGMVQIGSRFLDYDDDALAVIVAHELAHNILRHTERLKTAGVSSGMLAEFGRNGRLNRRTEDEADALSVTLLANAGYDPAIAPRFWRGPGAKIGGGLLRARTHGSPSARAQIMERAIAQNAGKPRPIVPALIATRNDPL